MYKPVPIDVINANNKNKGRKSILTSGINLQKIIITTNITKEIKKSIRQTITVLVGTIRRGKYPFVSKLEFAIKELLASPNEEEKNCQGKVAAATKTRRGIPSGMLDLNNQPINVITTIVSKGLITLHKIPIVVCLYLTKISRQAKK